MTREDFKITEEHDRSIVSFHSACVQSNYNGDLGWGVGDTFTRLHCLESAEHFIQMQLARDAATRALWQRDYLIREVEAAINKRGLRKRLREIIEKVT